MRTRSQRGGGNVGCVIGLLVLVMAIVIAIRIVPTRVAVAELEDYSARLAEQASLTRNTDEKIAGEIIFKAQQKKLPVGKEDVKVRRDGATIYIEVRYDVPLDLLVTDYIWKVEHKIERPLF